MNEKINYMTAGEIAKKMNCTVRTVQYYDQIGLLNPSAYTEGKRRLYSTKDYITLHQIISLKELGFSLGEIKDKIMPAENIEQINDYLISQEKEIKENIKKLKKDYEVLNKFRKEMNQINKVDWEMFVEILSFLRTGDEHYWVIKYFEEEVFARLKAKISKEKGEKYIKDIMRMCDVAKTNIEQNIAPESKSGQDLAKRWWDAIMEFTGNDIEMINQMSKMRDDKFGQNVKFMKKFKEVEPYINDCLLKYFEK